MVLVAAAAVAIGVSTPSVVGSSNRGVDSREAWTVLVPVSAAKCQGEDQDAGRETGPPSEASRLFADDCAQCHAADGHGLMLNQPNFTDPTWQTKVTNEEMFKVIKFGREPMPFWTGLLTDGQIDGLVKYIRTLSTRSAGSPPLNGQAAATASAGQPNARTTGLQSEATTDSCYACHQKQSAKLVALYQTSAHFTAGKSCNSCHGGDPSAEEERSAHSLNFTGKPTSDQAIRMCGQCHRKEALEYKASHHFSEDKRVRRADCVECHGAHTVGNPAPDFSFNLFCSGCHGLEYLPGLQEDFQSMLRLSDDVRNGLRALQQSSRKPSDEILKRRREIQELTGEVVHKTDLKGGTESIPHILELGQELTQMIDREKAGH